MSSARAGAVAAGRIGGTIHTTGHLLSHVVTEKKGLMPREAWYGHGPRRGFQNGHRGGAPVVVLRSSGVLARCSARARRVTPYGPLEGPTTYKLPADKGPLCLVPERRAARPNFWPAACVELQATAKLRPVDRVSSGQFARSLRRSRVRAQYRARGPRPQVVAAGV